MDSLSNSRYFKGGFEPKMTRREASLILSVSPGAPSKKIKEAHKRIMLLNHPDRGRAELCPPVALAPDPHSCLRQVDRPTWLPRSTRPRTTWTRAEAEPLAGMHAVSTLNLLKQRRTFV